MQLNLTVEEINKILQALGNAPYVQVFELIDKVRQQTYQQMQEESNAANQGVQSEVD